MPPKQDQFDVDNWTTQVRKGLLEMCILNLLAGREVYAYDLVKSMTALHGLVISEGTIYPLLSRFRKAGLVATRLEESAAGPARRYYRLSSEGEQLRRTMIQYWSGLVNDIGRITDRKEVDHERLD